jgi:hypothetical protein
MTMSASRKANELYRRAFRVNIAYTIELQRSRDFRKVSNRWLVLLGR